MASKRKTANLRLQQLESRATPATFVSPTKISYLYADGDNVTVTFSKAILTPDNANTIFAFNGGSVNGNSATKKQAKSVDLTSVGVGAQGTTIRLWTVGSASAGGDGFAVPGKMFGSDHYGIVTETVGSLKIGSTSIPLTAGTSNDDLFVGITGDFKIHET